MADLIFIGSLVGVLLWAHKIEKMHDEVMRAQECDGRCKYEESY